MFERFVAAPGTRRKGAKRTTTLLAHSRRALLIPAVTLLLVAAACAPASSPTPTSEPTQTPAPEPTWTPVSVSTPTPEGPQVATVEGLVMMDNDQLIIGVDWPSKSRITYLVQGGDVDTVRRFLGETARVTGEVVDRGPWLKEMVIHAAEASTAEDRLSMRSGFIKEMGISIYLEGTHLLTDRAGNMICVLSGRKSGLDLDSHVLKGQVAVTGTMTKTVEGNAQIMEVKIVEKAE